MLGFLLLLWFVLLLCHLNIDVIDVDDLLWDHPFIHFTSIWFLRFDVSKYFFCVFLRFDHFSNSTRFCNNCWFLFLSQNHIVWKVEITVWILRTRWFELWIGEKIEFIFWWHWWIDLTHDLLISSFATFLEFYWSKFNIFHIAFSVA